MAHVPSSRAGQSRSRIATDEKKVRVAPPLGGRYARSEGSGSGPERRHNAPRKADGRRAEVVQPDGEA